jgi:hypothetical protein
MVAPLVYGRTEWNVCRSPLLSWQTYTLCTALSLFKLIIHTSIGSTIHSFSHHYLKTPTGGNATTPGVPGNGTAPTNGTAPATGAGDDEGGALGTVSTVVGIALCIALLVYLSVVARRAVDDELGEDAPAGEADAPGALARVGPTRARTGSAPSTRARASIDVGRGAPHRVSEEDEDEEGEGVALLPAGAHDV